MSECTHDEGFSQLGWNCMKCGKLMHVIITELKEDNANLKRQLSERRTVTDEMRENAKHYWQTHGMAKMPVNVFIDGMLTAALEAGEDE